MSRLGETTRADGGAEIEAGLTMLTRIKRRHGLTPRTAATRPVTQNKRVRAPRG